MPLLVNGYLTRGHVAIIAETESTYVMIESTLRFNDVQDIPCLLPLLRVVQRSHMWSRERSRDGLGTRLNQHGWPSLVCYFEKQCGSKYE